MAKASNATIDHDVIRQWVEERGGHPATVGRTAKRGRCWHLAHSRASVAEAAE